MDKPILVFGATGLLGTHLVRLLVEKGRFPVAVVHNRKSRLPPGVPTYQATVASPAAVSKALHRYGPSVVINCAAYTDVDGCELNPQRAAEVNTLGAENIVHAAQESGALTVHISTDYVFDGSAGPYDEAAHAHPINVYGKTKHDAETIVQNADAETLIIRAAGFIGRGPEKHPCFAENMIAALRSGKQLAVPIDQVANVTDVPTLARGVLTAVDHHLRGIWHMGSRELISRYDLTRLLAHVFGLDAKLSEPVMYADMGRAADRPLNGGLLVNKAEEQLALTFPSPKETLENLKRALASE